jgi:acyl-CoA thioester hydrolase
VPNPPRGARFDRHMEFTGEDGKARVRSITTWAMIDKASGRPLRVPPEVAAPFLGLPAPESPRRRPGSTNS